MNTAKTPAQLTPAQRRAYKAITPFLTPETLTPARRRLFDRLVASGDRGLTHKQLALPAGGNVLPDLIFGGLAEHVKESTPARYRALYVWRAGRVLKPLPAPRRTGGKRGAR